jgi:hypothetical protein
MLLKGKFLIFRIETYIHFFKEALATILTKQLYVLEIGK